MLAGQKEAALKNEKSAAGVKLTKEKLMTKHMISEMAEGLIGLSIKGIEENGIRLSDDTIITVSWKELQYVVECRFNQGLLNTK